MTPKEVLRALIEAQRAYRSALDTVQTQGGEMFKAIRQEYGLTQRQLADALKVDFSFISKVENGHLRPGKPVLQRLAAFLEEQQKTENSVARQ